ncbi:MAG: ATP-dependent DNA helicase RecG [Bacteroidetes bacterium]|nr:MAG: ATP-dependent DNA helicase RecG [Bacteroidota bacterium]
MTNDLLNTSIEYLKGVGPVRADVLKKELKLFTFSDLLSNFPFRYVDRSKFYKVNEVKSDAAWVQIKGHIKGLQKIGKPRGGRLVAYLEDDTGRMELVWFRGIQWMINSISQNEEYVIFGKPNLFNGKLNIPHPELEAISEFQTQLGDKLQPFYNSTEKLKSKGLDSRGIGKIMKTLMIQVQGHIPETLSEVIKSKLKLISREEAIINIHFPKSPEILHRAESRLKFEELFFIQLNLLKLKLIRMEKTKGNRFTIVGDYLNNFYKNCIPFELTGAQKRVIKEIRIDMGSGHQMNRLLQGDVGSGKTLVALMCMLIALDNNFQACLMAPTEILAQQHFKSISKMLDGLDIQVALLTGSTKAKQRTALHELLQSGHIHVLIGTHALIEDTVKFKNLGLVVIDEQHRFGVAQRAKLWKKNTIPPHILVMTATPIPRTLAMTLYGDLEVSVIDELPPGRKAIKTVHFYDKDRLRLFGFMQRQIAEGRQVYIVYPLINESEKLDLKHLMDGYESVGRAFPLPKYAVSMVHGKLKSAEKDYEMQRFIKGETQIMVATTVIEVGVDVPNASVMVIENAERFGLSQLHQLRGRVGRGADQSYCILMTKDKLNPEAFKRVQTMVKTSDGFEIAEVDLKLRGPGDLHGTQQSGILDLKIADIVKDEKILRYARQTAIDLLKDDPNLQKEANIPIANQLKKLSRNRPNWSLIS